MGSIGQPQAPTSIFELMVCRGQIPGHRMISVFGENPDLDIGTTEDIWAEGGVRVEKTSAGLLSVLSSSVADTSAGTGARTVLISGLDAGYVEISETVILNGTTRVATALSYIRVNHVTVVTAGSGETNAGIIRVDSGAASDVLIAIAVGNDHSLLSHYCVPDAHTAYIKFISVYTRASKNSLVEFTYRETGGLWTPRKRIEATNQTVFTPVEYTFPIIGERSDMKLSVIDVGVNNTPCGGSYSLLLIADGF